jgi:hypothetical protein
MLTNICAPISSGMSSGNRTTEVAGVDRYTGGLNADLPGGEYQYRSLFESKYPGWVPQFSMNNMAHIYILHGRPRMTAVPFLSTYCWRDVPRPRFSFWSDVKAAIDISYSTGEITTAPAR